MRSRSRPLLLVASLLLLPACGSRGGEEDWAAAARDYCREVASARPRAAQDFKVVTANLEQLETTFHLAVEGTAADRLSPVMASIGTSCYYLGLTLGRAEGYTRGLRPAGDEVHRRAPPELAALEWRVGEPARPLSELLQGVCAIDGPRVVEGDGVAVLRGAEAEVRGVSDAVAHERERVDRAFGAVLESCAAAGAAPTLPAEPPRP